MLYIEGSHVIFLKKKSYFSLKIDFVVVISAYPDEMPHYAAFHLIRFVLMGAYPQGALNGDDARNYNCFSAHFPLCMIKHHES